MPDKKENPRFVPVCVPKSAGAASPAAPGSRKKPSAGATRTVVHNHTHTHVHNYAAAPPTTPAARPYVPAQPVVPKSRSVVTEKDASVLRAQFKRNDWLPQRKFPSERLAAVKTQLDESELFGDYVPDYITLAVRMLVEMRATEPDFKARYAYVAGSLFNGHFKDYKVLAKAVKRIYLDICEHELSSSSSV